MTDRSSADSPLALIFPQETPNKTIFFFFDNIQVRLTVYFITLPFKQENHFLNSSSGSTFRLLDIRSIISMVALLRP
ncbi:MAG: hypothetical protein SOX72_06695, partial [Oscillospiraceae bacterium]|nr:hypothetical protein [Oscillospiraceae bacterium]